LNLFNRFVLFVFVVGVLGACTEQGKQAAEPVPAHKSFTMESQEMKETRRITVYVPPQYSTSGSETYPVLYMPDGGIHEDFPHLATTIDTAIRAGEMQPVILVGVENTVRRRDMTGPTEVEEDRKVAPVIGGSEKFRAFFANELIPHINAEYRVSDESGIIGESLAAYFIVEILFLQPDLFDKYIALSPSIWWNDEEIVRKASERLRKYPRLDAELYLSSANEEDIYPAVQRLSEVLRRDAPVNLRWKYVPRPDLRHNNIYRTVSPTILRQMYPVAAAGEK